MSTTTFGWLVLACPIAGTILIGFGFARWPGRSAGWIATFAIALSFVFSVVETFLVWLVTVTLAPFTAAPEGSVTVPRMLP